MEVDDMQPENEHEEVELEQSVSTDQIFFRQLLLWQNHKLTVYFFCLKLKINTFNIGHLCIKCFLSVLPKPMSNSNGMALYSGVAVALVFEQCVLLLQVCDNVVDTTALLRSCVQSAVGMLRDQVQSGFRSTRRVEILLTLLSDHDNIKGANNNFVSIFAFCYSSYSAHHAV